MVSRPRSDAGNWVHCGRKWIDPADPDGRTKLDLHHFNLCFLFPAFAQACPHARFVAAIAAVAESWSRPMKDIANAARCRTIADFAPPPPPSLDPSTEAGAWASDGPPAGGSSRCRQRRRVAGHL
jgi:hypothetical protein